MTTNGSIKLKVGLAELEVEVPKTPQEKAVGLSLRDKLEDGHGMLFKFDEPGRYEFACLAMNFRIDIIWIVFGRVAEVTPNVIGSTYRPYLPVTEVLEVPAGWAAAHDIKPGCLVTF